MSGCVLRKNVFVRAHMICACVCVWKEKQEECFSKLINFHIHVQIHIYTSHAQALQLFDDQWKEKQEECFSKWINFLFKEHNLASDTDVQAQTSAALNDNAYIALSVRRRDDRARWRVASVWESPELRPALYKLDKEVLIYTCMYVCNI